MVKSVMTLLLVAMIAVVAPVLLEAQAPFPKMTAVTPDTAKIGDTLVVEGENLQKGLVAELYLTDGKNDTKVEILEQAETSIKFKVPAKAKTGRWGLMILTSGKEPKLIEQPVKVTIE